MIDPLDSSRRARAHLISRNHSDVVIFKENPLYEYFSLDERAEAIVLHDGMVVQAGDVEVDASFSVLVQSDFCVAPPHFEFRSGTTCKAGTNEWFKYPLSEELRYIQGQKKSIGRMIDEVTSRMTVDDTEKILSKSIKEVLCASGLSSYYEPIVAFDENTLNIWNRPGEKRAKKIMYIEAAVRSRGLTVIYSNSFLLSGEESYTEEYRRNIEAMEIIKNRYVEGNETGDISSSLEKFRNDRLYLTTPLYPFSYHSIPGENVKIRVRDVAVFDLWNVSSEFGFRKKVIAVAGSYRAMII